MYKLLIVDDEPIITDGLYHLFKENQKFELDIFKAYSAEEAIDRMQAQRVDILLSDIKMPEVDGFQLLKRIRESWPQCRVIFLTGYNYFDYVYEAIKHEGVYYLLKTEGDEQIVKAVQKAIEDIEKSLKDVEIIEKAKTNMAKATVMMQKEFITELLTGEKRNSESLKSQLDELGIKLRANMPVSMALGQISSFDANITLSKKMEYVYLLTTIAEKLFMSVISYIHIPIDSSNILWLIQPAGELDKIHMHSYENYSWERVFIYTKEMVEMVQTAFRESSGVTVSFVVDSQPVHWEEISRRFMFDKSLLNFGTGKGKEFIISERSQNFTNSETGESFIPCDHGIDIINENKISLLELYLETSQRDKFHELLDKCVIEFKSITSMHYFPAIEVFSKLSLVFITYVNWYNLSEKLAFSIGLSKLTRIEEHDSWKEAIIYLKNLGDSIFELQNLEHNNRSDHTIAKVKQFIRDHIGGDLSLSNIADTVYHNPSYISRLFKQVTGTNISDFIITTKMEKAKELLANSRLKVQEIGSSVGFESPAYFTRVFRKVSGMTPQEFRDFTSNK